MLYDTNEFLQPEYSNPFPGEQKMHSIHSLLDQVLAKVNGSTSVDLSKKMNQKNEEKKKKERSGLDTIQSQKQSERVKKIFKQSNLISRKIIKQEHQMQQNKRD